MPRRLDGFGGLWLDPSGYLVQQRAATRSEYRDLCQRLLDKGFQPVDAIPGGMQPTPVVAPDPGLTVTTGAADVRARRINRRFR